MDTGQDHKFIRLNGKKFAINMPCDFSKTTFNKNGHSIDRYDFVDGKILTITHNGNEDVVDSNFRITQLADGSFAFTDIPNPTFRNLHA